MSSNSFGAHKTWLKKLRWRRAHRNVHLKPAWIGWRQRDAPSPIPLEPVPPVLVAIGRQVLILDELFPARSRYFVPQKRVTGYDRVSTSTWPAWRSPRSWWPCVLMLMAVRWLASLGGAVASLAALLRRSPAPHEGLQLLSRWADLNRFACRADCCTGLPRAVPYSR